MYRVVAGALTFQSKENHDGGGDGDSRANGVNSDHQDARTGVFFNLDGGFG